jgi:hypothetical protein
MPRNKRPELNQVVEEIYDAALDSARWKDTIAVIAAYVGGQAGGLALKDCQSKNVNVFYDVGFDQECIDLYCRPTRNSIPSPRRRYSTCVRSRTFPISCPMTNI